MLFSVPNILTFFRILVIPAIIVTWLLWNWYHWDDFWIRWIIFSFYTFACITDFFDGYIARQLQQVSQLGRFLDPIADKLLIVTLIFLLSVNGDIAGIHLLAGLIILIREITVSGLREFLAELHVSMPVTNIAKWKTVSQMLALGFLIVGPASPSFIPSILIGTILIWTAAILTTFTGIDYLRAGLRHMIPHTKSEKNPSRDDVIMSRTLK